MYSILIKFKRYKLFRYISIRKIWNLTLLFISYLFSKNKCIGLSERLPFFISVETANYCNLHCPECPVGINKYETKANKSFDYELYKKMIDELKSKLIHVILYFQGEPFLNKSLIEFIRYAHESKIYTSTSTNAQFINRNNAQEIVMSGLDKLIVSMDGTTQEVYEKYRVGGSLEKVLDGIKNINYWKTELKSSTPFVEIQFLVLRQNEHQMSEMRRLAKNLSVDVLKFKTAQLYDFENGNDLLPTRNRHSRYKTGKDGKIKLKGNQPNHCWRLWSGAVINSSGEVLPCCFDKGSDFSFGNINQSTFSACWHSKKAYGFREKILENRKQFEMCRNCTS